MSTPQVTEDERRAEEARQLLRNPLLNEALATISARLVEQLSMVDVAPDRVLRLQAVLAAHHTFERYLKTLISTGKMASLEEARARSLRERIMSQMGVR